MTRFLIAGVVFAGAWFLWSMLGLPAWSPVSVMGHALSLRFIVAGCLACVAFGGQK